MVVDQLPLPLYGPAIDDDAEHILSSLTMQPALRMTNQVIFLCRMGLLTFRT